MKRLFPRAVPEALSLLGLFVLVNGGCSPNNNVQPGAPVLTQLAIVENGGATATTITKDTGACAASPKSGDVCYVADDTGDGGTGNRTDLTPCQTTTMDWCRCKGDPSMSPAGMWDCDPFAPMSVVIATFDRLLDTDPLDPGDAGSRDDIATIMATPTPPTSVTTAVDYSATGSANGELFNVLGPAYHMNYRSFGPSLQIAASPAQPTSATVTFSLVKEKVLAKDGKTQFVGAGPLLADGTITFKTGAFGVQIAVPTAPPPPADAATDAPAADAPAADAAADAPAVDAAVDAGAPEGGAEAGTEAGSEAGTDGGVAMAEAGTEAGATDAATTEVAMTTDAGMSEVASGEVATADAAPPAPPTPGAPVPADMNMAAVTITFNNLVDPTAITAHISVTQDGQPFTSVAFDTSKAPVITLTPAAKAAWAPGKTYVIDVDKNATDVVGDKLGTDQLASFVMAN
jgi:hypothetical protein